MNYLSSARLLTLFAHLFNQSACYYIFWHCLWLPVSNTIQDLSHTLQWSLSTGTKLLWLWLVLHVFHISQSLATNYYLIPGGRCSNPERGELPVVMVGRCGLAARKLYTCSHLRESWVEVILKWHAPKQARLK